MPSRIKFTHPRPLISPLELASRLSELDAGQNPIRVAVGINSLCRKLNIDAIGIEHGFNLWHAAGTILFSFYRPSFSSSVEGGIPLGTDEITSLMSLGCGLARPTPQIELLTNDKMKRSLMHRLEIACAQTAMQGNPHFKPAFLAVVFGLNSSNREADTKLLNSIFVQEFGCNCYEYLSIMTSTTRLASNEDIISISEMEKYFERYIPPNAVRRVLLSKSCSVTEIYPGLLTGLNSLACDGVIQQFYTKTPFILLNSDTLLAPPPQFLILMLMRGAFFAAVSLAARKENKTFALAGKYFGPFFEEFIRSAIKRKFADFIVPEIRLRKGITACGPDGVLVLSSQNRALLIEAKLRRLSPETFFGIDWDFCDTDCENIAKALFQSVSFAQQADLGAKVIDTSGPERSEFKGWSYDNQINIIVVVPMTPPIFNSQQLRDKVDCALLKLIHENNMEEWYLPRRARFLDWRVADFEEWIWLLETANDPEELLQILDRYSAYAKCNANDWESMIAGIKSFLEDCVPMALRQQTPTYIKDAADLLLDSVVEALRCSGVNHST